MYLDIFSVLNTELLANVSCNSFIIALMTADYEDEPVVIDTNAIKHNNVVSIVEFKYGNEVMCIGYPVTYDKRKNKYTIELDDVVVAKNSYNIINTIANSKYVYKIHNKTTAKANSLISLIEPVIVAKCDTNKHIGDAKYTVLRTIRKD